MTSETTPLIPCGVIPPHHASGNALPVYFASANQASTDARFNGNVGPSKSKGWFNFLTNVGKKSNAVTGGSDSIDPSSLVLPRKSPTKVDPKVFFSNERTFLAWMHMSVILTGVSIAIVAFADAHDSCHQLYGVMLLPVSIAFIIYSMMQCEYSYF